MTRQLEQALEERQARRAAAIVRAVEFELVGMLASQGAELHGFSVKLEEYECLLTLRATVDSVRSIAFVGAEDMGGAIVKAVSQARGDKLNWREDGYAKG